jgi:uncharacterized membrane protein
MRGHLLEPKALNIDQSRNTNQAHAMPTIKKVLLWTLALAMIAIGVSHFLNPEPFMRIVPPPLPKRETVYLSGVFEVLGGAGLLLPQSRRWAAWGLVALYVAVFPANLYMAFEGIQLNPANPLPAWGAWVRLPFQILFISWAWWFTREPDAHNPTFNPKEESI